MNTVKSYELQLLEAIFADSCAKRIIDASKAYTTWVQMSHPDYRDLAAREVLIEFFPDVIDFTADVAPTVSLQNSAHGISDVRKGVSLWKIAVRSPDGILNEMTLVCNDMHIVDWLNGRSTRTQFSYLSDGEYEFLETGRALADQERDRAQRNSACDT